jgi:hypothetical protein
MDEHDWLAERFTEHRNHLRAVAYRMLGSFSDADDAVQEAWLRPGARYQRGQVQLGEQFPRLVLERGLPGQQFGIGAGRRHEPVQRPVSRPGRDRPAPHRRACATGR